MSIIDNVKIKRIMLDIPLHDRKNKIRSVQVIRVRDIIEIFKKHIWAGHV